MVCLFYELLWRWQSRQEFKIEPPDRTDCVVLNEHDSKSFPFCFTLDEKSQKFQKIKTIYTVIVCMLEEKFTFWDIRGKNFFWQKKMKIFDGNSQKFQENHNLHVDEKVMFWKKNFEKWNFDLP